MSVEADLAAFQAQLLTHLHKGSDPAEIAGAASTDAPTEVIAAWIDTWDPACVILAGELIRTWGTRE